MRFLMFFLIIIGNFTELDTFVPLERPVILTKLNNKLIKVAIIDTGMNLDEKWPDAKAANLLQPKICSGLSKDFTHTTILDEHGHGTHIAGLIAKYAEDVNYCLIIYKYFKVDNDGIQNLKFSNQAFQEAINQKVDLINYSGGGIVKDPEECGLIKLALDRGIKIVAAAGNEGVNLNFFHFYPAMCDPRVIVVEGIDQHGERMKMSNYSETVGLITSKEPGKDQLSLLPGGQYGYMSGTSQATAIHSGKLIKKIALATKEL